jgi:hypothetical protein
MSSHPLPSTHSNKKKMDPICNRSSHLRRFRITPCLAMTLDKSTADCGALPLSRMHCTECVHMTYKYCGNGDKPCGRLAARRHRTCTQRPQISVSRHDHRRRCQSAEPRHSVICRHSGAKKKAFTGNNARAHYRALTRPASNGCPAKGTSMQRVYKHVAQTSEWLTGRKNMRTKGILLRNHTSHREAPGALAPRWP